jgi:hypothetical protein
MVLKLKSPSGGVLWSKGAYKPMPESGH